MLTTYGKDTRLIGLILLGEFLFFTLFLVLVLQGGHGGKSESPVGIAALLTVVLFIGVLLTCATIVRHRNDEISALKKAMEKEKQEQAQLRKSLERNIEDKTFELQKIVGALNREIGERTQAEEELRELQKQQELILDSAGEGILGLDNTGKVIFMNNAAEIMLGWEKEELINNTHHRFIHHTRPDGTPHPMEDCPIYMAYKDGQIHYKTGDVFWCKNGTSFPVEYVSTPIRDRGMLTGAVVVFRDMNTFS